MLRLRKLVRGLMMLTSSTAKQLKVDRLVPAESIDGGARYLLRMKRRLPERIEEPDRTLLALAAYNVGLGHLEDARVLTAQAGGDPDKWAEVSEFLPRQANRKSLNGDPKFQARNKTVVEAGKAIKEYEAQADPDLAQLAAKARAYTESLKSSGPK